MNSTEITILKNMRKKCSTCNLICFIDDEICKRCGSEKLLKFDNSKDEAIEQPKKLSFWSYLIFLILALIIEFFALLPVLANIGWRHSAGAPLSDFERKSQFWAFVLHLPTALFPWLLNQLLDIFTIFYLFIPFTQIIFWTIFLAFLWKKLKSFMESSSTSHF